MERVGIIFKQALFNAHALMAGLAHDVKFVSLQKNRKFIFVHIIQLLLNKPYELQQSPSHSAIRLIQISQSLLSVQQFQIHQTQHTRLILFSK